MMKSWLAATAAIALIAGAALAQSETTTTTSTVTNPPAAGDNYSASKTVKTYSNGAQTEADQTYQSGLNGTTRTYSKSVTAPDGARQNTYHEEQTTSPDAVTTTKKTTTTTTTE